MEHARRWPSGRAWVSLVFVALALLAAGCGGGSGSSSAKSTGLGNVSSVPGQSQLIASAEAICKKVNVEIAEAQATTASFREILRVVPKHRALERRAADELAKLTPPTSLKQDWSEIVTSVNTLSGELGTLVAYAKHKDKAGIASLTKSKRRVHHVLLTTAERVGVKDCGLVGVV